MGWEALPIVLIGGTAPLWIAWLICRLVYRLTHGRWRSPD